MSRNDVDLDPLPDEPPPPYEPVAEISSTTGAAAASTAPAITSTSATHNPSLAPEEYRTSTQAPTTSATSLSSSHTGTNPFLTTVAPQQTGASTATPATAGPSPALPPRTYAAAPSSAPPPTSPSTATPADARPSIDSRHSRHSSSTSAFVPVTPPPQTPTSPSIYAPPSGAPPPTSATSPYSSSRPAARRDESYRPTTVPTPGQPLLRKGKILVYPRNWPGCPKCNDTGYKHGDPSNPHKSCWDKYGKTYTSAMSYSTGLANDGMVFQKALPVVSGVTGASRPSHGYVPGGYPGAAGAGVGGGAMYSPPLAPQNQGYTGYGPPVHPPPPSTAVRPPRTPTTPTVDAETEGARMSDVPPNYVDASNVAPSDRLPSQYVPPPMPPPGHGPPMHSSPPRPPHIAGYHGPQPPLQPPGNFVGGFGPNPGGPNPYVSVQPQTWYGARPPPPGALVVMPGDPRIGGRLCFECGGRGMTESFWFGDETCFRCRGSGRIF